MIGGYEKIALLSTTSSVELWTVRSQTKSELIAAIFNFIPENEGKVIDFINLYKTLDCPYIAQYVQDFKASPSQSVLIIDLRCGIFEFFHEFNRM